jgi:hypothetical protein
MGRPLIDIPDYVIGAMKDYANREEMDVDEAYTRLLVEKLQDEGILPPGDIPSGGGDDTDSDDL